MFNYKTVKKTATDEIIEKKSRFIAYVMPVANQQQAIDFISSIRSKHYDASHNVYAYVLKDDNIQRYSDDGEPSGTAGVPVLEVIKKEGLVDTCIVVTRYFGGTMLGAGGLVRAYTRCAKVGVDASGILHRRLCYEYKINVDYTMIGKIQNEMSAMDCIFGETLYEQDVTMTFYVPYDLIGFEEKITDITSGRAIIKKDTDGRFIDVN